ncbi:MAG: indolepyruvate ferredoxin oxidoreductase [Lentisphaeria bacterium]|jgi:indolepyruvate ferredoxin oxidoreductase
MLKTSISLDDKYELDAARAYMTGIDALVRLPMLQHQRDKKSGLNTAGFISGYRGSPLGGLDQSLVKAQKYLDRHDITFKPGINEDLAATAVWGSQQVNLFPGAKYDGVFAMWYGKGPGVDRSMDVIKHGNAFGTSKYGGVLAVAGDDHACKSSTLPHQSEHMFIGASIPVLSPSNVQEVLDLGVFGWELSRYSGCWVALKAITENMDSAISADIDPSRVNIIIPADFELPPEGLHGRWPSAPLEQERILNKYRIYAARNFAYVNQLNKIVIDNKQARLGIITAGKAYLDVMQALDDLGIDTHKAAQIGLRVYKLGMTWPLEPKGTHEFAKGLEEILVVEEKRSIIEDQLTGQLYNWPVDERPCVVGEFDEFGKELLTNLGELTPAMVARAIASRIGRFYDSEIIRERLEFFNEKERTLALPRDNLTRAPHYCSGCPHNISTKVPEGSRAMAGIGCHYMVTWMNRNTDTFTQMGGEGVSWIGQAPFTSTQHIFQNLGDGTYFHSGILAIRAALAADVNITYKILYNDAVAMTGGQAVDGVMTVDMIVHQLRGEGVKRIAVLSDEPKKYPYTFPRFDGLSIDHRDKLDNIQRELREQSGTTVIIYDQTCAAEKRRRRKKKLMPDPALRVIINEAVCEGCGDCSVASNCLSILPIETELGRKRVIDQSACNKDFSCVNGFCPSFVTVAGGALRKKTAVAETEGFEGMPEPLVHELERPWNILVSGIGGTGVLTVSAILAMAAFIEGKGCSSLNQTGLAQKFGAVVSHVRIGKTQEDIFAARIAAGDADLMLGCDLVVSDTDDALAKLHHSRSHVVINEFESPTSTFISNPDLVFPAQAMKTILSEEVAPGRAYFINATALATALMGDSIACNMFLMGCRSASH